MKATINIQEDAELRLYIKDIIKGQVLSIVREDIFKVVRDEIDRKVKNSMDGNFNRLVSEAFYRAVKDILSESHDVQDWNSNFVQPQVEAIVNNAIAGKNWDRIIDELAKKKVMELIK